MVGAKKKIWYYADLYLYSTKALYSQAIRKCRIVGVLIHNGIAIEVVEVFKDTYMVESKEASLWFVFAIQI